MENDIGKHPFTTGASHHGESHHEIDSLRNFYEVKPMENAMHELFFAVGGHECAATVSGSTVNPALSILILSVPSTSHLDRTTYAELQQQRQLALAWATALAGVCPMIVEPWHASSGPTRRRSHEV